MGTPAVEPGFEWVRIVFKSGHNKIADALRTYIGNPGLSPGAYLARLVNGLIFDGGNDHLSALDLNFHGPGVMKAGIGQPFPGKFQGRDFMRHPVIFALPVKWLKLDNFCHGICRCLADLYWLQARRLNFRRT